MLINVTPRSVLISVKPRPPWMKLADWLISQTVNRALAGSGFFESPQQTHRWNYQPLAAEEESQLDPSLMVSLPGLPNQGPSHWHGLPRCHAQICGGWRNYVTIEPILPVYWYVGWKLPTGAVVSRIRLLGPVRMLWGDQDVSWFGLSQFGKQLTVQLIDAGSVGTGGPDKIISLL